MLPTKLNKNSSLVRISIPQIFASNAVNLFLETPERAIEIPGGIWELKYLAGSRFDDFQPSGYGNFKVS